MAHPQWLIWARELQALAQSGLTYADDPYDRERYERVREIAAAMFAAGSGDGAGAEVEALSRLFAEQQGYATPKVDVRGAAFRDGRILMVQEQTDGLWSLPGGWADVNQSPEEAVLREIREETGFEAETVKLAALLDRDRQGHPPFAFSCYKVFFLCRIVGGEARPSFETPDVGFFGPEALPPLSPGRILPEQIALMFAHQADPDRPTDFD